jgi:hypothetical protein
VSCPADGRLAEGAACNSALGTCSRDVCCPGDTTNAGNGTCDIANSNIVFVSSTSSAGNLGGLAGADTECNKLAAEANLAGRYHAWLSAPGAAAPIEAPTRVGSGPFVTVNGDIFGTSVGDLLDRDGPDIALNVTEWSRTRNVSVWTGTTGVGDYSGAACSVWNTTAGTASGTVGNSATHDGTWTDTGADAFCPTSAALYCFQDGCFANTMTDPNNCGGCGIRCPGTHSCIQGTCGAYAFVTSTTHNGDFDGIANATAMCNTLAAAAGRTQTFTAWLSASGDPANARILDAPYYRFDNRRIAASRDALFRQALENPINIHETGAAWSGALPAWTGTSPVGTFVGPNCTGWSVGNDGNGIWGNPGSVDDTWTFGNANGVLCQVALHIYCFQVGR